MAVHLSWILLALVLTLFVPNNSGQITVRTDNGLISGKSDIIDGTTVHSYLGIPYVQPPIGSLRFMPPKALTSAWSGVLNGSQYKNSCPQFTPVGGTQPNTPEHQINEDCLYINVFTTKPVAVANMSVLVWIHGGGFIVGTGAGWKMQTLAAKEGIVVVSMNYRLGAFGFLTSGEDNPGNNAIQPNLGILDQQMALKWVQDNIENFGGNKEAVTIAGFSAGAYSVGIHVLAPSSYGLFRYAIMHSGAVFDSHTYKSMAEARQAFLKFGKQAGCNGTTVATVTQCVRSLSVAIILKASSSMLLQDFGFFSVTVDGKLIVENPRKAWAAGRFKKGNLLMGIAAQDGYVNVPPQVTRPAYLGFIKYWFNRIYNDLGQDVIISRYTNYNDINSLTSNLHMLRELSTDSLFVAPADFVAGYHSIYSPTYTYVFSHRTNQSAYLMPNTGVSHGAELPYVFGYPVNKPSGFLSNFTSAEIDLSKDMMAMWGSFIRTG
ncbi:uncharacterized protein TRIADDRAFT_32031 [Trichoplax adhaerens]|uniref:Carboxylic ester hydrolase n=1 Tax=Trichoplax adhaerens TaxID=10228 RepID=B3SA24_TRIAD|nr:hypothetical protein TRIADDRAFT_32031 [Trichoplax adhaerens]EDV20440.1 hypothetical protein TRIADDRAFT_32031 [Trichoplax adhaerens]|eukprot:XP_002117134.1 hypothetical protein TRIADDRAFT_32031 [Trichoplax adhaerens]